MDSRPKPRTHHSHADRFKNLLRAGRRSPGCRGHTSWPRRHISSRGWNRTRSEIPIRWKGARLNPLQCVFVDEERGLDGAVVSPEPHGMPRLVIRAAMIWKVDHGTGRSSCRCRAPAFRRLSRSSPGGRRSTRVRQEHGRSVDEDAPVAPLSNEDLATGQQSDSMPIATNSFLISLAIRRKDHYIQLSPRAPRLSSVTESIALPPEPTGGQYVGFP